MFFSIKLIIFLLLTVIAGALVTIGSRCYVVPMRIIFGKERLRKKGAKKLLGAYLVVTGCAIFLIAIMVLF